MNMQIYQKFTPQCISAMWFRLKFGYFFSLLLLMLSFSLVSIEAKAQDAPAIIAHDKYLFIQKKLDDLKRFQKTINIHKKIKDYNRVRAEIVKAQNTLKDLNNLSFFDVTSWKKALECLGFQNQNMGGGGINWKLCGDLNTFAEEVLRNGEDIDKAETYRRLQVVREAKQMGEFLKRAGASFTQKLNAPGYSNAQRLTLLKDALLIWEKGMELSSQIVFPELSQALKKERKALAKIDKNRNKYLQVRKAAQRLKMRR